MLVIIIGMTGCTHWNPGYHQASREDLMVTIRAYIRHQKFKTALEMIEQLPFDMEDQALFQKGIVLASTGNPDRDKEKALACFQAVVHQHPVSRLYNPSFLFVMLLNDAFAKQKRTEELIKQNHELKGWNRTLKEKNDLFKIMVKKKDQEIKRLQDEVNELKSQLQQFKAIDLGK